MKKGTKQGVSYVSVGHEVYKNLFSGLLFELKKSEENINNGYVSENESIPLDNNKFNIENENDISTSDFINKNNINIINNEHKNSKIDDPNDYPEFETTEEGSLIFAIEGFNDENILRTANALNNALNKQNDKVDINTFLEIYRLFAEFRWALSCRLKPNLKLSRDNDIHNYHKYSHKTGEEMQTKEFYSEDNDTTKIDNKLKLNLDKYRWSRWQLCLWLLGIIPGLIHEIWRRRKIKNLKTVAANEEKKELSSDTNMNTVYKEKEELELKLLALPTNFIIERQLAFLQANEVFFKNMILKSNDPKFLNQMKNKSINTFLRENHNLVNSTENYTFCLDGELFYNYKRENQVNNAWENKIDQLLQAHKNFLSRQQKSCQNINIYNNGTIAYKKNIPTDSSGAPLAGGMANTHRININGKNYFTKKGKLFLDFVSSATNEKCTEGYRGNLDEENSSKDKKTPLVDTASHGCTMKAFDNFLGLNVLVDTKLIVTPDGYDVFMKSAKGKNAGDIFWAKDTFRMDERHAAFIQGDQMAAIKEQRLNNLRYNPLSSKLQYAIMKTNFLDYLCSNHDRYTTNSFVWKNGLHLIDNEYAFFTGIDWTKQAYALCIKEDLPNLIPYATKELYNIAQSCLKGDGLEQLINIYMIFAKTANEKNLLQGAENIRTRAEELYDHFKQLEKEGRILKSVENFNSKTAKEITEKSLIFNRYKQDCLQKHGKVGTATGMGALGYANPEIQKIKWPQPKQEKNLSVIPEEDENLEDDKDDIW